MSKEIIWQPSKELVNNSKLTKFLRFCKVKDYDELENKSSSKPEWLWENVIKFSNLKFFKSYNKIMDESKGIPWTKWCVGGKTNLVLKKHSFLQKEKMVKKVQSLMMNLIKKYQKLATL